MQVSWLANKAKAEARAKLWLASPIPVPEDFANITHRFIQDWAATQSQCPRPGFPFKRRRSVPRALPQELNPDSPRVDLVILIARRNTGRPRRAAAPESKPPFSLDAQTDRAPARAAAQSKHKMGRNVADLTTHWSRPVSGVAGWGAGRLCRAPPSGDDLEPVDPPRNHPWVHRILRSTSHLRDLKRSRPPVSRYAGHANTRPYTRVPRPRPHPHQRPNQHRRAPYRGNLGSRPSIPHVTSSPSDS